MFSPRNSDHSDRKERIYCHYANGFELLQYVCSCLSETLYFKATGYEFAALEGLVDRVKREEAWLLYYQRTLLRQRGQTQPYISNSSIDYNINSSKRAIRCLLTEMSRRGHQVI